MILLDTNAATWAVMQPGRLSRAAARAIEKAAPAGALWIAGVSLYELSVMLARGEIRGTGRLGPDLDRMLASLPAGVLDITSEIATIAASFPADFPGDPMDRIISATARAFDAPLITSDRRIRGSGLVETIW
jgi:PIN domain nuclease of toxin-antitoxin system